MYPVHYEEHGLRIMHPFPGKLVVGRGGDKCWVFDPSVLLERAERRRYGQGFLVAVSAFKTALKAEISKCSFRGGPKGGGGQTKSRLQRG